MKKTFKMTKACIEAEKETIKDYLTGDLTPDELRAAAYYEFARH